jgi:glycosyltransferase involved in cell wall biosynthesis/phosphoheptose isomerase
MTRLRIAMVSEHASPLAVLGGVDAGGQNVHVAALATELARRGAEVVVHTRRDSAQLADRVELAPGVTVDHVAAGPPAEIPKDDLLPHMDRFADELTAKWRIERPDIVHSHFWMSGYASLIAARRLEIPVVHTFHALGVVKKRYQGEKDTSPAPRLAIERDVIAGVDHTIATCTDEVFELVRQGADNDTLSVIPCGVDLSQFGPEGPVAPRREGLSRLLYVGRLVERKGVGNAISAMPALARTELVIAGGPDAKDLDRDPEAIRLRALAEQDGVGDRVRLLGRLDRARVPEMLRSADAVVCIPWYEPFGIVPLEAMACGVPVIASAVGGMIDSVVDGRTGVHVPPRDPDRFAEAASSLVADSGRRRALGRAGVERARRLYDWRRIADATAEVYEHVQRERSGRRRGLRDRPGAIRPSNHLRSLEDAFAVLRRDERRIQGWGRWLAARLDDGGRLLAVGNGGSAAQAQHLTAELVGRYVTERRPLSAIPLHADTSTLTAIGNDYGDAEMFARQVHAHGRPGDVLVALSTSGQSENVLCAVSAAREIGMSTLALTGAGPNGLGETCDEVLYCPAPETATVQELHLIAIHMICEAVDNEIAREESVSSGREEKPGVLA